MLLIPVSLAPFFLHMAGAIYAAGAVLGGVGLLAASISFMAARTNERARRLFLGSITYLPATLRVLRSPTAWPSDRLQPAASRQRHAERHVGILLAIGYVLIKRRQINAHRNCMLMAFASSTLFLISYVVYHVHIGSKPFQGTGPIRYVYFTILISTSCSPSSFFRWPS